MPLTFFKTTGRKQYLNVPSAPYQMICSDNHQASILSSSTSIRLQGERVKPGDGTQYVTQIFEHFLETIIHEEKFVKLFIYTQKKQHISKNFEQSKQLNFSWKVDICKYLITLSLFSWGKRVNIRKARPCHWHHFSCCIQFHCTRSQRNHTVA